MHDRDPGQRVQHPAPAPGAAFPLPRRGWAWSGLTATLLVTALILGGSVAAAPWDGVYLFRDFVTVPDPVLGANTLGGEGAPRAVPLDAVVAALSTLLPAPLVGRVLLVSPLLLVGSGMTVLLRRYGPVATGVGAAVAIANPYVAERLLLGQAPSLLGYAVIPWLVVAVRSPRPLPQRVLLVLLAAAPAALTPVGAVMAAMTVLVTALVLGGRRAAGSPGARGWGRTRDTVALLAPIALLSLPWIVTGLAHPTTGASPEGASAFAVRSDTPLGVVGSVATLGGVWATGAVPASRDVLALVLLQVLLVLGALLSRFTVAADPLPSDTVLSRSSGTLPSPSSDTLPSPSRRALDLAVTAYLGTVLSVLLLAGPLLPAWSAAQRVPGVALLRDTHRWLGWGALGVAVLLALGLAVTGDRMRWSRWVGAGLGLTVAALAVLTVPDVPARLARDLSPVALPPEWDQVVELVNDEAQGRVLLLPWQPFRQTEWAGPMPFLDPFPRALEPEAVHARDLLVRRDGRDWWVGGEDPAFADDLSKAGSRMDTGVLREEGIGHVLVWLRSPGELPVLSDDLTVVHTGAEWMVLEVP